MAALPGRPCHGVTRDDVEAVCHGDPITFKQSYKDWIIVLGLSEREVEVLRLLARGLSNRETAGQLFISKATVNHHVRHVDDTIGVSTRPAATLFAVQHGLLEPAPAVS
jgi:DNA-binding NarL/FixJ family response regulator